MAGAWPLAARAQQPAMPVIAFMNGGSAENSARNGAAFIKGLSETGLVEGRDVKVEFHGSKENMSRYPVCWQT